MKIEETLLAEYKISRHPPPPPLSSPLSLPAFNGQFLIKDSSTNQDVRVAQVISVRCMAQATCIPVYMLTIVSYNSVFQNLQFFGINI